MTDFEIILDILNSIIYEEKKSNDLINKYADMTSNLAFVTKNVYGVLENKIYLDYMIRKLSSVRLKKIHKSVLTILEIGFYNIHFLESKDYATVDKLVELTKSKNKRSSGFVNAILRNFIRDEKEIATIYEKDHIKSLSIRYSFPEEITRYIFDSYGMDFTKAYLRDANSLKDLSIRTNLLKISRKDLKKSLEDMGYEVEKSQIADAGLLIKNPSGLVETEYFKKGYFTIQGQSSMKVVEALDPKENSMILDLCAAPGTKTSYLAEFTKNTAKIIANDISTNKNILIEENISRLGLENIRLTNYDGSVFVEDFREKFDYVLVDAPCSGLGVVGRKPEIRYNRTIEDIYSLADLQKQILDQAIKYLKVGGVLLYSTCTLGPLENKDNFLYLKGKENLENIQIQGKDFLEYKGFEERTDGFFIIKFKKI